jgi:hypothetical protein
MIIWWKKPNVLWSSPQLREIGFRTDYNNPNRIEQLRLWIGRP